jgi:hypothetical protein
VRTASGPLGGGQKALRRPIVSPNQNCATSTGTHAPGGEVAQALQMSAARLSQLLDLVLLAPDIQEELLHLELPADSDPIPERALRHVVRPVSWAEQRRRWAVLRAHGGRGSKHEPWAGQSRARTAKKEDVGCRI